MEGRGRFINCKTKEPLSWKETLVAACDFYGSFSGRWHDNDYWKDLRSRADSMTEEEAFAAVQRYENEADAFLETWRMYQ